MCQMQERAAAENLMCFKKELAHEIIEKYWSEDEAVALDGQQQGF